MLDLYLKIVSSSTIDLVVEHLPNFDILEENYQLVKNICRDIELAEKYINNSFILPNIRQCNIGSITACIKYKFYPINLYWNEFAETEDPWKQFNSLKKAKIWLFQGIEKILSGECNEEIMEIALDSDSDHYNVESF